MFPDLKIPSIQEITAAGEKLYSEILKATAQNDAAKPPLPAQEENPQKLAAIKANRSSYIEVKQKKSGPPVREKIVSQTPGFIFTLFEKPLASISEMPLVTQTVVQSTPDKTRRTYSALKLMAEVSQAIFRRREQRGQKPILDYLDSTDTVKQSFAWKKIFYKAGVRQENSMSFSPEILSRAIGSVFRYEPNQAPKTKTQLGEEKTSLQIGEATPNSSPPLTLNAKSATEILQSLAGKLGDAFLETQLDRILKNSTMQSISAAFSLPSAEIREKQLIDLSDQLLKEDLPRMIILEELKYGSEYSKKTKSWADSEMRIESGSADLLSFLSSKKFRSHAASVLKEWATDPIYLVGGTLGAYGVKQIKRVLKGKLNPQVSRLSSEERLIDAAKGIKFDFEYLGRGTLGATDKFGKIFISPSLKNKPLELAKTKLHERVHSVLSPKLHVEMSARIEKIQTKRAELAIKLYQGSPVMRCLEEALAEGYAQRSISEGIKFPFENGYLNQNGNFFTNGAQKFRCVAGALILMGALAATPKLGWEIGEVLSD